MMDDEDQGALGERYATEVPAPYLRTFGECGMGSTGKGTSSSS